MARTVDTIKALIYAEIETKTALRKLFEESPSQVALWKEIIHDVSVGIAIHEQIMDEHLTNVQISRNIYNADWLRERVFEFQYSASTPQVTELNDDLVPVYSTIDEDLQIISVCVFYFDEPNGLLYVRVAKNDPPEALSALELAAFEDYLIDGGSSTALATGVGVSGISHISESLDPDYIWLEAAITYTGSYADTIEPAVKMAIVNYYHELERDGHLRTVTLIDRIQAVPGVKSVVIENLAIRANADSFTGPDDKVYLVTAYTTNVEEVVSTAGYAYEEITAGETLTDKLTFIAG